jgi:hypothetical protein
MPMKPVNQATTRCAVKFLRVHRHADELKPTREMARSLTQLFEHACAHHLRGNEPGLAKRVKLDALSAFAVQFLPGRYVGSHRESDAEKKLAILLRVMLADMHDCARDSCTVSKNSEQTSQQISVH